MGNNQNRTHLGRVFDRSLMTQTKLMVHKGLQVQADWIDEALRCGWGDEHKVPGYEICCGGKIGVGWMKWCEKQCRQLWYFFSWRSWFCLSRFFRISRYVRVSTVIPEQPSYLFVSLQSSYIHTYIHTHSMFFSFQGIYPIVKPIPSLDTLSHILENDDTEVLDTPTIKPN